MFSKTNRTSFLGEETAAASAWVQQGTGGTTHLLHMGGLTIPYTDLEGIGQFHIDVIRNDTVNGVPAGVMTVDMIFSPEYPA